MIRKILVLSLALTIALSMGLASIVSGVNLDPAPAQEPDWPDFPEIADGTSIVKVLIAIPAQETDVPELPYIAYGTSLVETFILLDRMGFIMGEETESGFHVLTYEKVIARFPSD